MDTQWTTELELGLAPMDQAHRRLLEQVDGLLQLPDAQFFDGLEVLVDCMEADFGEEEMLMETIGYPAIQGHLEQHARVLATLHGIGSDDVGAARAAVALIDPWFRMHIETADAALAVALNLASAPQPPQ